jgi:hypothetical protein
VVLPVERNAQDKGVPTALGRVRPEHPEAHLAAVAEVLHAAEGDTHQERPNRRAVVVRSRNLQCQVAAAAPRTENHRGANDAQEAARVSPTEGTWRNA